MLNPSDIKVYLDAFENGHLLNIVACSRAKIWKDKYLDTKSYPARVAYKGGMFKQATNCFMDFKSKTGVEPRWVILSAKYGFIEPDQEISDYNISFSSRDDKYNIVTDSRLLTQWKEKEFERYHVVFLWGGEAYAGHVRNVLSNIGNNKVKFIAPAVHLRIGEAQQALKNFRIALANGGIKENMSNFKTVEKINKPKPEMEEKTLIQKTNSSSNSKYYPLKKYLEINGAAKIELEFSEIESILGFSLPESAFKHAAWWGNGAHSHSLSWAEAGYKTATLVLPERRVHFIRVTAG
jgi:hypothetical protein